MPRLQTAIILPFPRQPLHYCRVQVTARGSRQVWSSLQKSAVNFCARIQDWTWPIRRRSFSTWRILPRVCPGECHYCGILQAYGEVRILRMEQRVCPAISPGFTRLCDPAWEQRNVYQPLLRP